MNATAKREYKHKWDRFQKRWERIYTTKFKKALQTQAHQQTTQGYITSAPIYEVLLDLYRKVGPLWAFHTKLHKIAAQPAVKARMPMGFNERIVELMKLYFGIDLLVDAEQMTQYSREVIAKILEDAATSGASINDVVRSITGSSEFGEMRARRIARTETVTAANGAAIINAKELGLPMRKIWLAIHDKRTRHSHRSVDNVTIPLDDSFLVGAARMGQPGARRQPNGSSVPPQYVVNCRCTLGFEVIE